MDDRLETIEEVGTTEEPSVETTPLNKNKFKLNKSEVNSQKLIQSKVKQDEEKVSKPVSEKSMKRKIIAQIEGGKKLEQVMESSVLYSTDGVQSQTSNLVRNPIYNKTVYSNKPRAKSGVERQKPSSANQSQNQREK